MYNVEEDFQQRFPNMQFQLKDFQKKVISNVVEKGSTLCIMPTGGGKSVIYWMAGLACGGTTIVVSPLIALMEEQSQKIKEHGYKVLTLHGGVQSNQQVQLLTDYANGQFTPDFIFVSPEKIGTDGYFEYCLRKRRDSITLMVVDEVHCVSQWGLSFRPFYQRIPEFMNELFGAGSWCKVLSLTATINPKELQDVCESFKIDKEHILKDDILMRTEVQLHVKKFSDENQKEEAFWELLERHKSEKVLVYLYRKRNTRGVTDLAQKAEERGYRAGSFHGDMNAKERMEIIEKFKSNKINVVIATNAFGMGIDIPDIRVVIHFMIPESVEQYYQEIGRASRDSKGANAYLLYSDKNISFKKEYFIDGSFPQEKQLRDVYQKIVSNQQTGYKTFDYFEDEEKQLCLPYYIRAGLIEIVAKGFSGLKEMYDINCDTLQQVYDSTNTKGFNRICKKNDMHPKELSDMVYEGLLSGKFRLKKQLERWLVLKVNEVEISEEIMTEILEDIERKKQYKETMLDYFANMIEGTQDSRHLHQEIAKYLGMDTFQLGRIYTTADGNRVRSKSEVIICNLLASAGITYKYEEPLLYGDGERISPDFTIYLPDGSIRYWEHLGMLGNEEYDARWADKLQIYERYFPGQLIKTYESGTLSKDVEKLIQELQSGER
ncbi:RecQ family ATP-dependent DNA helicase [Veillonella sp. CHU732]|uniref:RecQ family ATP-dependent DNA helicase n=1 Tax=Veillonella sp. CHU732 TaxID=2490949 RepID=UPI000F8E5859|nr:RecQ family ATP-dependent DNA helicase [Veillonella sp. CHU732]